MDSGPAASVMRETRTLYCLGTIAGMSDAQLLERFVMAHGEASELAFRALVSRHGPMVLGVCRRILPHQQDAEDAFQATFLIFVRKARTVSADGSLARWLYGVSRRVAVRARKITARRRMREVSGVDRLATQTSHVHQVDLRSVIDDELRRLPETYRAVVLLCDLEGLSQEEAASRLRCPVGTIKSRLFRAHERLRARLTKRGFAPSVMLFHQASLCPAISPALADATVRAAAGTRSLSCIFLMEGVLRTMALTKLRNAFVALVALGLISTGTVLLAQQREKSPLERAIVDKKPATKGRLAKQKPAPYVVEPPDLVVVEVLEALPGRPVTGERLVRPDGTISLGFYGDLYVAGMTTTEIKEKVIERLSKTLSDEALGLIGPDPDNPGPDGGPKWIPVAPKDSGCVFVDVASYNSKVFYVDGEVAAPGRFPVTGQETVRDALHHAGGLLPTAAREKIRLIRPASGAAAHGKTESAIDIDYQQLVFGTDPSVNHKLEPGDRIIVLRDPNAKIRPASSSVTAAAAKPAAASELRALDERLKGIEKKLQRLDAKALQDRLDTLETTLTEILDEVRDLKKGTKQ